MLMFGFDIFMPFRFAMLIFADICLPMILFSFLRY